MYKNISPMLMPYSTKILPLEYDESMSYYEQLCAVNKKLNELIVALNEQYESILNVVNDDVKKELSKFFDKMNGEIEKSESLLRKELAKIEKNSNNNFSNLNNDLTTFRDSAENEMFRLQNEILKINTNIAKLYGDFSVFTIAQNKNIDVKIDSAIRELVKIVKDSCTFSSGRYILVHNPFKQKTTSLNDCLEDLMEVYFYYGITAIEYDSMEFTAEDFDSGKHTVNQYDLFARFTFVKELYFKNFVKSVKESFDNVLEKIENVEKRFLLRNPFTGNLDNFTIVIEHLVNFHRVNTMSCGDFDSKEKTTEQIDRLLINAYEYDFYGKTLII